MFIFLDPYQIVIVEKYEDPNWKNGTLDFGLWTWDGSGLLDRSLLLRLFKSVFVLW